MKTNVSAILAVFATAVSTMLLVGCANYTTDDLARDNAKYDAERDASGANWYPVRTTNFDVLRIEKNPASYTNQVMAFDGTVMWIKEGPDQTTFQLEIPSGDYDAPTLIVTWPKSSMPGIIKGNAIRVLGNITGMVHGTNVFGGPVEAVGLTALCYVDEIGVGDFRHDPKFSDGDCAIGYEALFEKWRKGEL